MAKLDGAGMLIDPRIRVKRFRHIEHGSLDEVRAIVVHQTDSPSEQATFESYNKGGNGAHFLIAKSGQIYQRASLKKRCYHVGRLIKSKCLQIEKSECKDEELAKAMALKWAARSRAVDEIERKKRYPVRFPVNSDSVGVELVGKSVSDVDYEPVTPQQNGSLRWLIGELYVCLSLTESDVYRHPDVSYKNPGEARDAKWTK